MEPLTFSLLLAVLSLFYYFCIKPLRHWTDRGIKQQNLTGILEDLFKSILKRLSFDDWMIRLYQTFPDSRYFGFYLFGSPALLIRDPNLIKQITVKDFDHFVDHRYFLSEKADPLWANNLVALRGQKWRDMRPVLSPFFTSSKMKQMFVLMSNSAKKFADYFLEKDVNILEVEFKDVITRYCNDIIATTAFGIEVDSLRDKNNEFYLMGRETTNFKGFWKNLRVMLVFLVPKLCEVLRIQVFGSDVRNFFYGLIDETVKSREKNNIVRPDMIHLLMQARKETIQQEPEPGVVETGFSTAQELLKGKSSRMQITNKEMASQAMIFFLGGFESVSTMICFMAYELMVNPNVQEKLRSEIEETFVEYKGELTYDALSKMKYLDMVVSETLRKWPTGLALDRQCTKPYLIEPASPDEKPLHLTTGDVVWIPVFAIHRDEKYFPNPDFFDPERFSDDNKGNINLLTYLPFGSGPRNCIGSRFALLECKAVIFHVLHNFEIVTTDRTEIPIVLGKTTFQLLPENGFQFGLRRIKS